MRVGATGPGCVGDANRSLPRDEGAEKFREDPTVGTRVGMNVAFGQNKIRGEKLKGSGEKDTDRE